MKVLGPGRVFLVSISLVDRDAMGKFIAGAHSNTYIYQELPDALPGGEWATSAYFNGAVFFGPVGGALRRFTFSQAHLNPAPSATTSTLFGYPGVTPSISSSVNSNGIVWAYENAANGQAVLSWVIVNTGDFTGDGKSDILWQLSNTSQYGVWFMNGTQVSAIQNFTLPPYAGQICCVADFDGDGLADLVSFNRSAGAIYFWKNTGSLQFALQTSYAVSPASAWLPVGVVRLNGASQPSALIWSNANTGEISAWLMNAFTWTTVVSFGNPGNAVVLSGFGDFSGDGKADLLLFDTLNNVVGYWQSNGAQQPVSVPLAHVTGTWIPVGAENLYGPGKADVIWRQSSTGALGAWQVSGSSWSVSIGSALIGSTWQLQPRGFTP